MFDHFLLKIEGKLPVTREELKELIVLYGDYYNEENTITYPLDKLDVSKITNMSSLFINSKFNGDTNEFIKVSAYFNKFLNKLNNLFKQCGHNYVLSSTKQLWRSSFFLKVVSLSQKNDSDINKKCDFLFSKWNTSNVTNMNIMFYDSFFNNNSISNWDVSNVTDMNNMFNSSYFNGDLSKWDVSNVKKTYYMFSKSKFNGDISNWNLYNCNDFDSMFANAQFDGDISKWEFNKKSLLRSIVSENINFANKYNNGKKISDNTNGFLEWFNKNRIKISNANVSNEELIDIDDYLISFNEIKEKELL